jgi:hypothetical protein
VNVRCMYQIGYWAELPRTPPFPGTWANKGNEKRRRRTVESSSLATELGSSTMKVGVKHLYPEIVEESSYGPNHS